MRHVPTPLLQTAGGRPRPYRVFRPPNSLSGASRADSSASGHLLEQENTIDVSDSDA